MNSYTTISAWMRFTGISDPTDSNNSTRRTLGLDMLQETVEEFCAYMDDRADWLQTLTTLTLAQGTSAIELPSTFLKMGEAGRVILRYSADDRRELIPLTPHEVIELQEKNGSSTGIPEFYYVGLLDTSDYVPEINVDIKADAAYTLAVYYQRTPPTLTDVNSSSSGLQFIPAEYHYSVLLKGLIAKGARLLGDIRAPQLDIEYQRAMATAKATRVHGQEDAERIGRSGVAAYRSW